MAQTFTPVQAGTIGDNPKVRYRMLEHLPIVASGPMKLSCRSRWLTLVQLWQSEVGLLPWDTSIVFTKTELVSWLKVRWSASPSKLTSQTVGIIVDSNGMELKRLPQVRLVVELRRWLRRPCTTRAMQ